VLSIVQYVYPHNKTFASEAEQEEYIREWLTQRAGLGEEAKKLNLVFYPGKYHAEFGSIFSVGDVPNLIPDRDADALILEEPEHLNWYGQHSIQPFHGKQVGVDRVVCFQWKGGGWEV
jgi:digalactosyldiacylglycerol synthase